MMNSARINSFLCPQCAKDILSRASKKCNWCGELLPDELRFSDAKLAELEMSEQKAKGDLNKQHEQYEKKEQKKTIVRGIVDLISHCILGFMLKK